MAFYITSYNDIDLPTVCSVRTPGAGGVHDLPALNIDIQKVPGGIVPNLTVVESDSQRIDFRAVVAGDCGAIMPLLGEETLTDLVWQWSTWVIYPQSSHLALVRNLDLLRKILRPDENFHPLVVADRPAQRIMAFFSGQIPVRIDPLPNDTDAVELTIPALCYPYWESLTQRAQTITAATDYIHNGGDLEAYPVYTITISDVLAGGLTFTVGSDQFEYTGALAATDVLVVDTDPAAMTVTLNGAADMDNTDVDAVFPGLAVGRNVIVRSDPTKSSMAVAFRQRYL